MWSELPSADAIAYSVGFCLRRGVPQIGLAPHLWTYLCAKIAAEQVGIEPTCSVRFHPGTQRTTIRVRDFPLVS